jgi:hypothetical protein
MDDQELIVRAGNRLKKLIDEREQNDFKRGWIYYKLKEEFGEKIARKVYREYVQGEST